MTDHVPPSKQPQFFGHPLGLFVLFFTEMWERFSYYGMRGLLVLYLTTPLTGMRELPLGKPEGFNPGRGWSDDDGSMLYGWYTGLAYLLPLFGGIVADKLIGTHRSMVVGGILIATGHVVLGISGLGAMEHSELGMSVFIAGLALIVIGTGHFKPSVSVMVGQLYPPHDPRRDGAFSIFYTGINVGAFICAFTCGTLGERVGWHWGFGSAAAGMLAGLGLYLAGRPAYLNHVGLARDEAVARAKAPLFLVAGTGISALFGAAYYFGVLGAIGSLMTPIVTVIGAVIVFGLAVWFVMSQEPADRGPVTSIFLFMLFNAVFWIAFEQAGSSVNLFTDRYTDRSIGGFEVPTTWFQSVNAAFVILLSPVFGWIWTQLGERKLNPSQPAKIGIALLLVGAGYVLMTVAGAVTLTEGAKASMWFVLGMYFVHTVGELFISPTGLSYVTKVAPAKFMSLLMGIWFISSFIANLGGGIVASKVEKIEKGEIELPWHFGGQADFFFLFVVSSVGIGTLVLLGTPWLKKLSAGRDG
jgi:POT family proton-dependent oligopeptide transporter